MDSGLHYGQLRQDDYAKLAHIVITVSSIVGIAVPFVTSIPGNARYGRGEGDVIPILAASLTRSRSRRNSSGKSIGNYLRLIVGMRDRPHSGSDGTPA